jgi:hypothetical protein
MYCILMNNKNVLAFILLGISLTLVLSPLLTTKALSITTNQYCFTTKKPGSSGYLCGDTKKECEEKRAQFKESSPESTLGNCFKFTSTDGNKPDKYCFDLATNDGKLCFDSKHECESERTVMLGGITAGRVASECYKNNA